MNKDNYTFNISMTRDQLEFVRVGLKKAGFNFQGDEGVTTYRNVKFAFSYNGKDNLVLSIEDKSGLSKFLTNDFVQAQVRKTFNEYLASMPTGGPLGGQAA